jgi:UDP-N-acetylmuramoyl-L-alanyl-D-glutamate--2,6-diaminopimelate ligase
MKLKKLFKNIPNAKIKGSKDISITGISTNSKLVTPGNLFIARKGRMFDGGSYIPEALDAGASAVLTDLYDPSLKNTIQIVHPQIAHIEGELAAEFYQHPGDELFLVGITGTNGKTTTSFLVKYLLDQIQGPCGLIGTIEYIVGSNHYKATRTTPEVTFNHKMLREMRNQGCLSAVMEVTSHALDQGRVDKIDYDIALFTNLTQDHLDYHATMEEYCKAKNILFQRLGKDVRKKSKEKWAIVNQDSPWTPKIVEGCQAKILTYGIDQPADLRATDIIMEKEGTRAKVSYKGKTLDCFWPLTGRFNVYNCLAAMAVALTKKVSFQSIVDKMKTLPFVRGRLEPVKNVLGLKIYVDFAHSDDALKNVLQTLNEVKTGKIITVFGCGGDRDKTKRPKMGEVSEQYSDFSFITSDNPRTENPLSICNEISAGFKRKELFHVEPDRRAAIKLALQKAGRDDIVLIAGKGHEPYQIFAHQTIEFDDVTVARDICNELAEHKKIH